MANKQLMLPANRAFNSNGLALPGAVMKLYATGGLVPANFYADSGLGVSLGSSITANGAGRFDIAAYQNEDTAFRLRVEDADGVELDDIDPFYFGTNIDADVSAAEAAASAAAAEASAIAAAAAAASAAGADQSLSQVINGLQVIWTGLLNFSMSAGNYYINGVAYAAAAQTITLTAADATNPRIDVLAVNTAGALVKVTGTAAANPSEPDVDPVTELKLIFVTVAALATTPAISADEIIYEESDGVGEWPATVTGTAAFVKDSTSEPDSGTVCVSGTSLSANNSQIRFNKGSTVNRDDYVTLILRIKSKTASWGSGRLRLHFQNAAGQRVGNIVSIEDAAFGFLESNISTYQQVAIPLTSFAVPAATLIQYLHITSAGAAFSLRIDNIKLQRASTATGGTTPGITQTQADARYAQRANNLADLSSAAVALTNLGVSTFVKTILDDADAATVRATIGLGTAAVKATGTSGDAVPVLNGASVTFTNDVLVPDEAYDASAWNSSLEVPTKNAVRDKVEALATLIAAFGGSGSYETAPIKPLVANYTLDNAGTASMANGTYGIALTMPSSTVNIRMIRLNAGLPGASWTAILRSSMVTPYATNTIHHGAIFLRNSTSGRLIAYGANNGQANVGRWASYTSFTSSILTATINYGRELFWEKITSDGTTLRFFTSSNGVDWGEVASEAIATYLTATGGSLDQIGFGSINGAASSVTNIDLFESFTVV